MHLEIDALDENTRSVMTYLYEIYFCIFEIDALDENTRSVMTIFEIDALDENTPHISMIYVHTSTHVYQRRGDDEGTISSNPAISRPTSCVAFNM